MLRLKLILLTSVLTLALPAWAESGPETVPNAQARPLNLSLPRDVLQPMPNGEQSDETVLRNLSTPAQNRNKQEGSAHLPYGAGYEHRHPETRGTSGSSQPGGSAGNAGSAGSGAGRRGR